MPKQHFFRVVGVLQFVALLGCSRTTEIDCAWQNGTGTRTPPTEFRPTHHAVVEGTVLNSAGQPLDSVEVGVPLTLFSSIPCQLQVTAQGGSDTDAAGAYSFAVETSAPSTRDGTANVYVYARKYAPPGGKVASDSALVPLRLVPLDEPPQVTSVDPLRLPVP